VCSSDLVWMLYNMGFVVKTPSGCFGIDVHHRLAEDLEPYLDFLCITHNHGDHANKKLIQAMQSKGKPVVSNFNQESPLYMSKTATSYTIGNFRSEEHTSELQSRENLVCRLLLEKNKSRK